MFEALLILAGLIATLGLVIALDGSHDVFHPLIFIGPMLAFLYFWMPWKLATTGGLDQFFDRDQILHVATLNLLGVLAFVFCCLLTGTRIRKREIRRPRHLSPKTINRLLIGGALAGGVGLACWAITIINVGGFVAAYSNSYSGGWDDNGYVRDGSFLMLVGLMMASMARSAGGPRWASYTLWAAFGLPWLSMSLLMARRGPTFEFVVVLLMGWYIGRKNRPPVIAMGAAGVGLGLLMLFLVTNRSNIYIGSSFDVKTDVGDIVKTPDGSNEWIYGAGTVLSSERRDHYFWMKRYLAQIMVRPIPTAVWPNKYADFGVPELLVNAGTGEGFGPILGWVAPPGSAPGIVADLWVEVWWFAVPLMGVFGWIYGKIWRKAVTRGGPWASQFVILSALTIYLVMQTMEAVIFRTILLSVPCWIIWRWAMPRPGRRRAARRRYLRSPFNALPVPARFDHA